MVIGTVLRDRRDDSVWVYYCDDGYNATVFSAEYIGKDYCTIANIEWEYLSPSGATIPLGAIPSRFIIVQPAP